MEKIKFLDLKENYLSIKEEIDREIHKVIDTTSFINGPIVEEFENNFSKYIGVKHCIGVGNGTDALEIAIQSLDLPPNSEIITQGNTFMATCLGVINNSFSLRLVDIYDENYMINVDEIEKIINEKTKVIIPVHMYGHSANMNKIINIAKKHNLYVIEDCAQAHGCLYNGQRVGSFGDIACFSFYPGKNLGAFGDGGAITTNNDILNEKIRMLKNLGSRQKYNHEIIGRNSRLDSLQAAILNVKLKYLDDNNKKRRDIAEQYNAIFKDYSYLKIPKVEKYCIPVYHLYVIQVKNDVIRNKLQKYLQEKSIETGIHYPISIQDSLCIKTNNDSVPISNKQSRKILSLPIYPELSKNKVNYIINNIIEFYKNYE